MALTPKQQRFCQLYIELGNASEAYRQAYNCAKMKPETVHVKANQLLNNGKVTVRIQELQANHAHRHNLVVDDLIDELEEARCLGRETLKAAAMVAATMGKARLLGFDKQIAEITGKDGEPIKQAIYQLTPQTADAIVKALKDEY